MRSNEKRDVALELYKMEYERCAERYENIYRAIWTNFSYMAILAGGILSFGKGTLTQEQVVLVAAVPLFFWWLATFEPLNEYGDKTLLKLKEIEQKLSEEYDVHLSLYSDFHERTPRLRVREVVRIAFSLLILVVLYLIGQVFGLYIAVVLLFIVFLLGLFVYFRRPKGERSAQD